MINKIKDYLIGNFQSIISIFPVKVKTKHIKIKYKNLGIRLYSKKRCNNICILAHGMGGGQDATYVKSMIDKLINLDFDVLTFDAHGIGESISSEKFWGGAIGDQGQLEDILEYINRLNYSKVFAIGFSAGAGNILAYLLGGDGIKNNLKHKIDYSFFVCPTINHNEMFENAKKDMSILRYAVSFLHTTLLIKHRLFHKKYKEALKIFKLCIFNIKNANLYGSGLYEKFYEHKPLFKINGLAILTKDDPITTIKYTINYKKYCETIIIDNGGHLGCFNFDGTKEYEKIIILKLKKIINSFA